MPAIAREASGRGGQVQAVLRKVQFGGQAGQIRVQCRLVSRTDQMDRSFRPVTGHMAADEIRYYFKDPKLREL